MASSSAWTASPGLRRGPPTATIASQNAPVPRPSSARPSLRMSSVATDWASTAGSRRGRLATLGATRTADVRAAIAESSVQASRCLAWYGWSCTVTSSKPSTSASCASSRVSAATHRVGGEEDAELQLMSVVRHATRVRGWYQHHLRCGAHAMGPNAPDS